MGLYSCHVYVTRTFVHWFPITAVLRVAGAMQKSTEVMKAMNSLVKMPEIQATMRELSKEMMKVRTRTLLQIFCTGNISNMEHSHYTGWNHRGDAGGYTGRDG